MSNFPKSPDVLQDADLDAASGGASVMLMGINRIVVTKPVETGQTGAFGRCACSAAKEAAAQKGSSVPGAWQT